MIISGRFTVPRTVSPIVGSFYTLRGAIAISTRQATAISARRHVKMQPVQAEAWASVHVGN